MAVQLRPNDVYTFSISVEVGGVMDDMSGVNRNKSLRIPHPDRAVKLGAGIYTWLGGWMLLAESNGWTLAEMTGSEVSFDKVMRTRDLDEVLDWFPFDGQRFCIYLASDDNEIFEHVLRRGQWWVVELTETEAKACRKG